ncbi:MAG: DUF2723 domain-containing protein [Chloroflexi bacterium]|nr:DUF2723 domain-containing protein [Chloroflexota bacterium]
MTGPHDRLATARWLVPAGLVGIGAFALYLRTLMPGLGFWDTGEFQALGPVLGIAHPTGYPSYTLLLWLASVVFQPFGEPALRANLLSAVLVAGAASLVSIAIVQVTRRGALGLAGGALLAIAPLAWQNAVRADPHAFHLALAALLLVLLIGWSQRDRAGSGHAGRWLVLAAVVFGVSIGNHALTLLLAPGVALFVLVVSPRILWRQWRLVLACLAAVLLTTVLVYAYLPLRSAMDPPLDYAHPADWIRTSASGAITGGFRYLVLGQQFTSTFHAMPTLSEAVAEVWRTLVENLGPAAWLTALGIAVGIGRRPRLMVLTVPWAVLSIWFLLAYQNADIDRYYLVPLLVAVLWAMLALDALWDLVLAAWERWLAPGSVTSQRTRLAVSAVVGVALTLAALAPVPARLPARDASDDTGARAWVEATLARLEPDPVVISWWSYSTPLWYARWVEGRRPDMTIIDDRDVLDDDLGDLTDIVAGYLVEGRPVYLIRLDDDLEPFRERFVLERLDGIPHGVVWRVAPGTDRGQDEGAGPEDG